MIMNPATLLLVEDEPDGVFFFQHSAAEVGLTNPIHVSKDGQEALDYLEGVGDFSDRQKFPLPELVILDLRLPRADGFEVLRRIRAHPQLGRLIVVMLTSSASDSDIERAYALGANGYLVKPLQLADLAAIVQAIKDFWLTHNHAPRLTGA